MKPLYILKIGGSVATHKNRPGVSVRSALLKKAAKAIRESLAHKNFDLILIHGAGAAGHQLAHKFNLRAGTGSDPAKWNAALQSRIINQQLDHAIVDIFVGAGLRTVAVHTSSVIIQRDTKIKKFDTHSITETLHQKCIPVLYGEMVFDETLGMSVCSGDTIAAALAKQFKASKIFFASDIDGIFTSDPHLHQDAKLLEKISWSNLDQAAQISASHNVDVTGGLGGKIKSLAPLRPLKCTIEIFNGLEPKNYKQALLGKSFPHTMITK